MNFYSSKDDLCEKNQPQQLYAKIINVVDKLNYIVILCFGMLTITTHVSLPRSIYWEDLNTVIILLQIVVAVFCRVNCSKGTHLRAKGKKVTCPGHKDCICSYTSGDHHWRWKEKTCGLHRWGSKLWPSSLHFIFHQW